MPVFIYKGLDQHSRPRSGALTAESAALARQQLRESGLVLEQLIPHATPLNLLASWDWRRRLPAERTAELWRSLALLLEAGSPLSGALEVCQRQQPGAMGVVLQSVRDGLAAGRSLSEALRERGAFDELTLALVGVGEQAGALSAALRELAEFQGRQRALANRLSAALLYPAILCIIGAAVVFFLMTQVVPQLIEVLASAGRVLPAPTRLLQRLSHGVVTFGPWLAMVFAAGLIGLALARRTPRGRRGWERLLLAIPGLGDLLRKIWVARMSMMLATMLKAEMRFDEALRIVRRGLPQQLLAEELERLEQAVQAGSDLAAPLQNSRMIPPLVTRLLEIGQESGELPRMLEQIRAGYEQETQAALTRFLALLEPALIVALASVIGFVVFATVVPILETTKIAQ